MVKVDIECTHDLDGFELIIATKEQAGFRFVDSKVVTVAGGGTVNRTRFEGPTLADPPPPLVFAPKPAFSSGKKPDWEGEVCVRPQAMTVVAFRSNS